MNDIRTDVDAVDLFDLQQGSITRVIRSLKTDRILPEATGRRDFVGAVEDFTRRLVRRRLSVRKRLLSSRDLVVVVVDFPDDNLPVGLFLPAEAGLGMQPQLS